MAKKKFPLGEGEEGQGRGKISLRQSTKADVVAKAKRTLANVTKSARYPSSPAVQAAAKRFEAATNALAGTNDALFGLQKQMIALRAARELQTAELKRAAQVLAAVVNDDAKGSVAALTGWGIEIATAAKPSTDRPQPPANLRVTFNRARQLVLRWKAVAGHRGYLLQFGDVATDTWDAPIHVTGASYIPEHLKLGEQVYVRVAVRRPSGQSEFSHALGFIAR